MLDQLLFSTVLMAPEIGAAANSAFKAWAGDIARDMAGKAVKEAVDQTKSALPFFLQNGINAVSGDLTPRIKKMAAETAESILVERLAGYAIVPSALYTAQLAVIDAVRTGGDVAGMLEKLDAMRQQ